MIPLGEAHLPESVRKGLTLLSILATARPLTGPYSLRMETSSRCNFSCLMCPHHSSLNDRAALPKPGFLDVNIGARILEDAAKLGTRIALFLGRGEPTLHPDFPGIVHLASRKGLLTKAFTNGSLLTPKLMEALVDAGLSTLAVSLVAPTPRNYYRYHPQAPPGTFDRVLDSLAFLQKLRKDTGERAPKLELRFIAMSDSHQDVEEMVTLGIQIRADSVHLSPVMFRAVGYVDALAPSRDEEEVFVGRLRELAPKATEAGLAINLHEFTVHHVFGPLSGTFPCYGSWVEANALVDGTITFCMRYHAAVGNVKESSLQEIWLGTKYQSMRKLYRSGSERTKAGGFDCQHCGLFYTNWQINRRLTWPGRPVGLSKMLPVQRSR